MNRIGNPEWTERFVFADDYVREEDELTALDDDYIEEKRG